MSSFPTLTRLRGTGGASLRGFKALSRMSSFPTGELAARPDIWGPGFKALSRMSSFPTAGRADALRIGRMCFKALSRMSSFPTQDVVKIELTLPWFQSAVAHELISNVREKQASLLAGGWVSKRCRA